MKEQGSTIESPVEHESLFDGGTFTINFLPDSPEGLDVETVESLPRHLPNTPLPEATRIKEERDKEPKKFRVGQGFAPKIGVRNIRQEGNTLLFDIKPVTFPTYRAINSLDETSDSLEASNPAATAGILLTTEPNGSHRFIIQHRSANNFFFGDIPGASVAGFLDGHLDPQNRGRLRPIDTTDLKGNLTKELDEELGIGIEEVEKVRITGIAVDKIKVHDEFLLFGISNLTTEQIAERVESRVKEKRPNDEFDFEGSYFIIPGTPDSIFTLLTQVKCPLPPTHTAAFIAAGYNLIIDRDGLAIADAWLRDLETAVKANYEEIDSIVRKYWMANTDKAVIKPDNKPERNLNGYDPAFPPTDQGLPDITSELSRTGLIENPRKEDESLPANAWLFDVDGVITNPEEKKITEPDMIPEILRRLNDNEPVAIVSGRAMPWLLNQVVNKIEENARNKQILENLFVSAEFGAVSVNFENGERVEKIDESVSIPKDLALEFSQLVDNEFSDIAFIDPEKVTHVTAEMKKGVFIEEFRRRQSELSEKLKVLVRKFPEAGDLEIHNDRIATNIKNKKHNKHLAVQKVLGWLSGRGVEPQVFQVFGDSASDFEMGRELLVQEKPFTFIYVGEDVPQDLPFDVIHQGGVDKGTVDYLKSN